MPRSTAAPRPATTAATVRGGVATATAVTGSVATAAAPQPAATAATAAAAAATHAHAEALDQSRLTHLVGYAASRAAITMKRVFARNFEPLDLKVVEFSILMLVAANADINQKRLGAALDVSAPNMAVTIDRMVERGWVERVRSTKDRRAMYIHLTPQGRELVARAEKIAATMEAPALKALSAAEKALLIELLMKVAGGKGGRRA